MAENNFKSENVIDNYDTMLLMLKGQISDEENLIANLSNASAIIKAMVDDINWAGFYLTYRDELVLGPFQGRPACNRIKLGKGVCGTAAESKKVMRIENVHDFEGHIACDSASNSEIVVPIIVNGNLKGVLDIDSPTVGRFKELEEEYFRKFVDILLQCNWE
ncbi:GAF domain-containing protein [Clostridium acidisoli DSM 12555]|uniref:GAF domain-containing protein n=2 Tax=Clostridium TaxID=1485 RepID=A0A1W1XQ18_9CLOT|nr:GAF domain-containing protein [Clostridium acidisoli]SMC25942.1 GAF domain-containing protein [Clostridium acidisoli DSM 12555]